MKQVTNWRAKAAHTEAAGLLMRIHFILLEAGQTMVLQHEYTHRRGYSQHLIHWTQTTAANVHDHKRVPELLHGEKTVACADMHYQGIAEGSELKQWQWRLSEALMHSPPFLVEQVAEWALTTIKHQFKPGCARMICCFLDLMCLLVEFHHVGARIIRGDMVDIPAVWILLAVIQCTSKPARMHFSSER